MVGLFYLASRQNLFKQPSSKIYHDKAAYVAKLILHGGEKEIGQALKLVKSDPCILRYETAGIDRTGRQVQGKLLTIAAMAGDVNIHYAFRKSIAEKEQGVVEKLIAIDFLSPQEIIEQLKPVASEEAKLINKRRNEPVISAIIKFAEGLILLSDDEHFEEKSKMLANDLAKDLLPDVNIIYTTGFVFDPRMLLIVIDWFEANKKRFGNSRVNTVVKDNSSSVEAEQVDPFFWKKVNAFWVKGFGKLQDLLCSRDAHGMAVGILEYKHSDNPRTLSQADGTSLFSGEKPTQLGEKYYVGINGEACTSIGCFLAEALSFRNFLHEIVSCRRLAIEKIIRTQQIKLDNNLSQHAPSRQGCPIKMMNV